MHAHNCQAQRPKTRTASLAAAGAHLQGWLVRVFREHDVTIACRSSSRSTYQLRLRLLADLHTRAEGA